MTLAKHAKVGIFDSGAGGRAFAAVLSSFLPDIEYIVVSDTANIPYGDKSESEIIDLTHAAIQPLLTARCNVIIIACNSATAAALPQLRRTYPHQLFIGVEPMLKPASSLTKSGRIGVCATTATLESKRYKRLKSEWTNTLTVLEPDCSRWAPLIESGTVQTKDIAPAITNLCAQGADVIVLACTHYSIIKSHIEEIAGPAVTVMDPTEALIRRLRSLL